MIIRKYRTFCYNRMDDYPQKIYKYAYDTEEEAKEAAKEIPKINEFCGHIGVDMSEFDTDTFKTTNIEICDYNPWYVDSLHYYWGGEMAQQAEFTYPAFKRDWLRAWEYVSNPKHKM